MTNLPGNIRTISLKIGPLYSLRNWIEYGFKQVKNELGWADYPLTDFDSIERWLKPPGKIMGVLVVQD